MTELGAPGAGTVRVLTEGDMPEVKAVIDSIGLFPSDMLDAMAAPWFRGEADAREGRVLGEAGQVAGVAYFVPERMTEGTWNLLLIAVHAERQGAGNGRTLMTQVEADLAARAARILLVETSGLPEFGRVHSFYGRCGFRQAAVIPDFYREGEDKVVFLKALIRPDA
jgi:GNAT superfamily N-acetyltransferase